MYKIKSQKLLTILSLVIYLIVSVQSYSQSSITEKIKDQLIGTWSLDYSKTIKQIKKESKEVYDSLRVDIKNNIESSFSQRKIVFGQDGTYKLVVNNQREVIGTWQLEKDNKTLSIQLEGELSIRQQIESINSTQMLLNLGGDQSSGRLFRKWYLQKLTN